MEINRNWMYNRLENDFLRNEFLDGIESFVEFAKMHPQTMYEGQMRYPCNRKKCRNMSFFDEDTVKVHIAQNGFVPGYYRWIHHGEPYIHHEFPNASNIAPSSSRQNPNVGFFSPFGNPPPEHIPSASIPYIDDIVDTDNLWHNTTTFDAISSPYPQHVPESPNEYTRQIYESLKDSEGEIWHGNPHGHSQLSVVARMLEMKPEHHMFERNFDDMCQLMSELCSTDNKMPDSFYSTKKIIKGLGLPVEKIDCYENNCMIYWASDRELTECNVCEHHRYKPSRQRTSKRQKLIPFKRMYYFPLTPRLPRLYASATTASHMRWHHVHVQDGDKMTHPSDSPAWKHFDHAHYGFASEPRNVRLGLSTDGFQPFGQTGQQYSSWSVILTPYNLPPWMCMKDEYMFLTVIVPGLSNPKDKLDVFLQPLIAELQNLWYNGAATYDISAKQNFNLRAALLWTISDFPAYAMLSGWSTAGRLACPHCMDGSEAFTLPHSGKTTWFDNHRKFLPIDHPLRRNRKMFISGRKVLHGPPRMKSGEQIIAKIDGYGFLPAYDVDADENNKEICTVAQCGWRRRSIFWELPYWRMNLIRHNLDVMHIEKNVFDNIFNTIMNVSGRTKDNAKSREDLKELCNRPELHQEEATGRFPKASFTLDRAGKDALCTWLKEIKFPDGYVSKLGRCVDMNRLCMFGMKSHDCHVFMQRLVPVAFKELYRKTYGKL